MIGSPLIQKPINIGKRLAYRMEKWLRLKSLLKSDHLTLPDFICAGVEKAGTTWLYENLKCHPDLFLPDRKELNYFSNNYRFYGFPLSYYSSYFEGSNKVKGEVTPCETMPLQRIQFMRKIMPDLKVILVIRNPIERAWSAALMHLIRAQNKKYEELTEEQFLALFRQSAIISKGDYANIIPKWKSVFPASQLHICFYDDLKSNPKAFLKAAFHFLGVTTEVDWSTLKVNELINPSSTYVIPAQISLFLSEQYETSISFIQKEYPGYGLGWAANS